MSKNAPAPAPAEKRVNIDLGDIRVPFRTKCVALGIDLKTGMRQAAKLWLEKHGVRVPE